ncbi:hypothetical protein TNIN_89581 [Trichonephila inaurata madagascariensis]|uniref:Uncharacterized protein n=1 Tax=Trichonephila inaurata madagascariensis TaxID=2747483 RepID=A0A8X6YQV6_9ARAC|nr:hypothetical protein TNIN_89581 [Trichonephila inaurata madagascariensis]
MSLPSRCMSIKGNVRTGRARGCGSTGMVMKISGGVGDPEPCWEGLYSGENKDLFSLFHRSAGRWGGATVSGLSRIRVSEKSGSRYAYCSGFSRDDGFLELVTADHGLGRGKMMLHVSREFIVLVLTVKEKWQERDGLVANEKWK